MSANSSNRYDVCVVGAGPAGVAAAVAAARSGAKTLLIERYGFLGGMPAAGMIHPWMSFRTTDRSRSVIAGFFEDLRQRLIKVNGYKDSQHFSIEHHCFDIEWLKIILQEMCLESGVELLLHSFLVDANVEKNQLKSVYIESKSGREEIFADVFVDGTGDGDLLARAKVPYEKGRKEDGLMQPVTLHFRMANVDVKRMPDRKAISDLYLKARDQGRIHCPRENLLWFDTTIPDQIHFNTTRVNRIDATNNRDLTRAEIESRQQTKEIVEFMIKDVPGFENSYLLVTAPQVGIRETRRMVGSYMVTERDLLNCTMFDDRIALGSYGVDIHSPTGQGTVFEPLPDHAFYSIPYRCMLPETLEGLIVAGRPVSSTHEAHSAIRIQVICYAMGQAAGVAAAMASKNKQSVRKISMTELQAKLRAQGAMLE